MRAALVSWAYSQCSEVLPHDVFFWKPLKLDNPLNVWLWTPESDLLQIQVCNGNPPSSFLNKNTEIDFNHLFFWSFTDYVTPALRNDLINSPRILENDEKFGNPANCFYHIFKVSWNYPDQLDGDSFLDGFPRFRAKPGWAWMVDLPGELVAGKNSMNRKLLKIRRAPYAKKKLQHIFNFYFINPFHGGLPFSYLRNLEPSELCQISSRRYSTANEKWKKRRQISHLHTAFIISWNGKSIWKENAQNIWLRSALAERCWLR